VGASGVAKLDGVVAEAVPPATLRSYPSLLDRQSLVTETSDVTELEAELEGVAADAVCPGRWRRNSSLLKPCSPVAAATSDGTELEGAVADADAVSPATLRAYSSLLDRQSLVDGASEDPPSTLT
jgi:hypothetical protein